LDRRFDANSTGGSICAAAENPLADLKKENYTSLFEPIAVAPTAGAQSNGKKARRMLFDGESMVHLSEEETEELEQHERDTHNTIADHTISQAPTETQQLHHLSSNE